MCVDPLDHLEDPVIMEIRDPLVLLVVLVQLANLERPENKEALVILELLEKWALSDQMANLA